ncbi:BCD family MFS transporter [Acidisphaera rubrifaciens]|uniref:Light harvesting pigment MFS transporter Bch2 n=1 Tax=Acidisphaera rubrifaciens HS-AP3 TaxID=1231350 RepID=A0A0D6P7R8_9PROT|nr:BCD family MFS transporter [Acidisphaera rubrifaciens]GAN77248.1 light harvesting pigment MFS transporter Bch2 [Acidisphaera rubrifaciens HS-AP3]
MARAVTASPGVSGRGAGWVIIARLGLVQASIGAVVVLATSTMNRVMVVELAMPALLPGALVALHYMIQVLRPRLGHGSDHGGRRTPWILGGMALLAAGGVTAAGAVAWMGTAPGPAIALAVLAYAAIGVGVGAAGTSLLVLLAAVVDAPRRPAAATIVWVMMMAGFAVTATVAGHLLQPYSPARLVGVTAEVAGAAVLLTLLGVWGVERRASPRSNPALAPTAAPVPAPAVPFVTALRQVWAEDRSRRFTIFVFASMLAYSAQELVLEPFAGAVFHLPPGGSTALAGVQHSGALVGMVLLALAGSAGRGGFRGGRLGTLRGWTVGGCLASAVMVLVLSAGAFAAPGWPLRPAFFVLGLANGVFAAAAIASMMQFAQQGRASREGVRIGLWGGAQAVAFGIGGLCGTGATDLGRVLLGSVPAAYAAVFAVQATLFCLAALVAARGDDAATAQAISSTQAIPMAR